MILEGPEHAMHRVEALLEKHQLVFAAHPFFARLRPGRPWRSVAPMVERLSFWVLSFHDILEQVEEAMVDPVFRRMAHHHHLEEGGHDRWFLADLRRLGMPLPDARELFGARHAATRRAAIRLLGEVHRCETDTERLALLLALEATGAVFFAAAAAYDGWPTAGLQFFSGHHLEVETAHQLFEERMRAWVRSLILDADGFARVDGAVARVFAAFGDMFDGFETSARASSCFPVDDHAPAS